MTKLDNIKDYVINCYADMKMVDFLLQNVTNYYEVLLPRHHKFVESYVKYKGSLKMVSATHGYSENDIKRIFWRIQKKLLLEFVEQAGKGKLKVKDVPETFDSFLLWSLEQFREDAHALYLFIKSKLVYTFNIDGVSSAKSDQIKYVLDILSSIEKLENILPEKVYPIAKDLIEGVSLTETVKKHNRNLSYVVTTIIGTKNPRSASERGWLAYVDESNNIKEDKIIQFPLR